MDPVLQEIVDHHQIRKVLAEYVHGCDRCDTSAMASVYWEDSWDDHGLTQASGAEFARIMTTQRIPQDSETLSHLLGQSLIALDGDRAGAETYFIAVTLAKGVDGRPRCHQLGGRYVDRLERRGGEWKIVDRIALRDWSVSHVVAEDSFARAQLRPGERSSADASYAALGREHGGIG
jgi:hypothetical protein